MSGFYQGGASNTGFTVHVLWAHSSLMTCPFAPILLIKMPECCGLNHASNLFCSDLILGDILVESISMTTF